MATVKYTYRHADGNDYPVIQVAADAVVHQRVDAITYRTLLVKRKDNGKWATPGGFVDYKEKAFDAAIRECKEETGVSLDPSWAVTMRLSDDPEKGGHRGRILSLAYYFIVPPDLPVPVPTGSDDAQEARWFTTQELNGLEFHEDHKQMILQGPPYA